MRKKLNQMAKKQWFIYSMALCSAVLFYCVLSNIDILYQEVHTILRFLSPIIMAIVIAYILNPIVLFFERQLFKIGKQEKINYILAVILTFFTLLSIMALFIMAIVPYLTENIIAIIGNSDLYIKWINNLLLRVGKHIGNTELLKIDKLLKNNMEVFPNGIKTVWDTSLSLGLTIINFFISLIVAVYLLIDKKRIVKEIEKLRRHYLKEETYERNTKFWEKCNQIFSKYLSSNFFDALIIGSVNAVFMMLMGMPYIAMISLIVGITNMLPTLGPIIGGIISCFILVVFNPMTALYFMIFSIVLQGIDAYIIKPKLYGNSLGIPSVLSLMAIIIGGKFFGIIGVFLSIPVVAVLCNLYQNNFLPFLEKRKKEE